MHRETSKFKQSVLTFVSPVSSVGIADNKIMYVRGPDNDILWGHETDWRTRSASSEMRAFSPDVRM